MELLRVFNKKRLCIFGLMIILNAVLFIMGNKISEQEIRLFIGIWLIAIMTI